MFSDLFQLLNFLVITTITSSVFQQISSLMHKENVLLKINANNLWFVLYFDYSYLIRLSDVTKPTI